MSGFELKLCEDMRYFSRVGEEFGMMVAREQNFEVEPGYEGNEGRTKIL